MKILPESRLGKWSIGLTLVFLLSIIIFLIFKLLGFVTFEGQWWDLTVAVAAPIEIIAFILSVITMIKSKERSVLIYLSTAIGICVVLFILLHSLFIND